MFSHSSYSSALKNLIKTNRKNKIKNFLNTVNSGDLKEFYDILYTAVAFNKIEKYLNSLNLLKKLSVFDLKDNIQLENDIELLFAINYFNLNDYNNALLKSKKILATEKNNVEAFKIYYFTSLTVEHYLNFKNNILKYLKKINKINFLIFVYNFFLNKDENEIVAFTLNRLIKLTKKNDINLLSNLAFTYSRLKKYRLANKYYYKLYIIDKTSFIEAYLDNLVILGNLLEAKKIFKENYEICKKNLRYFFLFSFVEKENTNFFDNIISKEIKSEKEINNLFEISKYYHKKNDFEKSYHYFKKANEFKKSLLGNFNYEKFNFESKLFLEGFKKHSNTFFETNDPNKIIPIFIIGLPRSGSTLVENIISSHPQVEAFHETNKLHKNFKIIFDLKNKNNLFYKVSKISDKECYQYGEIYLNEFKLSKTKKFFTDKMLFNFLYIGFIKKIIRNVKIIVCQRDYRDIGLSLLRNNFSETNLDFAYSERDIIKLVSIYDYTVKSWYKILKKDIYTLRYGQLVTDEKETIKNILDYCNLDHHTSVFDYHKRSLVVDTASISQANQKIYKSSVSNYQKYEKYLLSFFNQLDYYNKN